MLHILLLILKIIGIILATILGIVLLLICVVLFHAIGYEVTGHGTGDLNELQAKAKIKWLFGLVTVHVGFSQKSLSYAAKVAWKTILTSDEGAKKDESTKKEKRGKKHQKASESIDQEASKEHEQKSSEKVVETTHNKNQQEVVQKPEKRPEQKPVENQRDSFVQGNETDDFKSSEYSDEDQTDRAKERISIGKKITDKIEKIRGKIQGISEKIKCTIEGLYGKIEEVSAKKDHVMEFAFEETHIDALLKVKNEGIRLLKKLIPKKCKIDLEYGFEDPSITGKILALYSMFYPTIGKQVSLVPDFNQKIIKGDLFIKGKIRIIHFVVFALKLLLCKAIRKTYKDVRSFQL